MTKRDQYRPPVVRYWEYRNELATYGIDIPDDVGMITMIFDMPMPKSWSKKKKRIMDTEPHRQQPDIDNLVKAFLDSVCPDGDHFIPRITAAKVWRQDGAVHYKID